MRWSLVLLAALNVAPALAADAFKYDGVYNVALTQKPGLDGPMCAAFEVTSLRVEKGKIVAPTPQAAISGAINAEGRFEGQLGKANGPKLSFVGFYAEYEYDALRTHINATIADVKAGCGWDLQMVREPVGAQAGK